MNNNRVTEDDILAEIGEVRYEVDGTLTIAIVTMANGSKEVGESACVDPANFDEKLGQQYALENAVAKIWPKMGYALMDRNHRAARGDIKDTSSYSKIESIARVCHEVNRAYCAALGDTSQLSWDDAPAWQRESARMGVDLHMMGDFGPEASHIGWMNQKVNEGWTYGPVKDAELKQHPCMVPYDQLPQAQQAKDYIFRAVVHAMR